MSEQVHYGACNLCEAICGLEFRVRDGRIVSIRGDERDPLSRGHICPKAVALQDLHEDPDRLRKPQKRVGPDQWIEVGWDEAFDDIADRLAAIHRTHGANSVAAYLGNPSVHNWGNLTHASAFLGPLKTRSRYSATSVDQLPHQLVAHWVYGHQLLLAVPDIDRSDYILMLGANPMASNGSLWTVPDFRKRLKDMQARGGRLVLIDPRRTETAEVADTHHFIRPGSDAALLLALLNTIFAEGLAKPGRLADFADGLERVAELVRPFTPERAAAVTGIEADAIRGIARDLAGAKAAAAYGRMGVSTQAHGTLCQWALLMLNIATGNLDRVGGMMFPLPAMDLLKGGVPPGHYGAWKTRVRGLPEFGGELPVSALAEEILTPGQGQVRALITIAGNPVLSTPNGRQLEQALGTLEFMVSVDCYRNETTRFADYILPPTSPLEHDHYDMIFHHLAVRNTAKYSAPIFAKPAGALHDWEIFVRLGRRLRARLRPNARKPLLARLQARIRDEVMFRMPPHRMLDMALRRGPYGKKSAQQLTLAKLEAAPHGIDLGPLTSQLPRRLFTRDKRLHCLNAELEAELVRYDRALAAQQTRAPVDGELWLIGRRHVRSNNSWMHNAQRLVKGKPRHQLLMHADDLAAHGLADGARVRVRSRVGSIEVEVQATQDIMRGVVSLPHGWGHARPGVALRIAREQAGQSVNDLTDDQYLDALSGNAALNGVPVTVAAAERAMQDPAGERPARAAVDAA